MNKEQAKAIYRKAKSNKRKAYIKHINARVNLQKAEAEDSKAYYHFMIAYDNMKKAK